MTRRTSIMAVAATALIAWNGAAHASRGDEPVPEPLLLALGPMPVPIVDHGSLAGRLELRAMWQASDAAALARAEQGLPQLRATLVAAAADHARIEAAPSRATDPAAVAARLQAAAGAAGFSGKLLVLEAVTRAG